MGQVLCSGCREPYYLLGITDDSAPKKKFWECDTCPCRIVLPEKKISTRGYFEIDSQLEGTTETGKS
jgi:hypothetical protein